VFERFTENARDVVRLASDEARGLSHDRIGTEHLLLAFVRRPELPAAEVLASLGADETSVRAEVERIYPRGDESRPVGQMPFTPQAKKSLELALREALALGHNHIGSEHLLLGLVRVDRGGAAEVLATLHIDGERLRDDLLQRMPRAEPRSGRRRRRGPFSRSWGSVELAPATGTSWEYRVEHPPGTVTADWLNELGAERWELVGTAPAEFGGGLIFKRQRPWMQRQVAGHAAEPDAPAS